MGRIIELIKLCRPWQWYKNVVIFLPAFFMQRILIPHDMLLTFIGFIALCLISSSNYIINDIIDVKKDRSHPEKSKRPLAARKVTVLEAGILAAILIASSVLVALHLNPHLVLIVGALFALTLLYSSYLKNIVIADIVTIGVNFVLRAIAGTIVLSVETTPWLIICPFFFSLFLSTGKRYSDILLMKEHAPKSRAVLKHYTLNTLNMLIISNTTLLLVAYSLFSFQRENTSLILTLPLVIYAVFEYSRLIYSGSPIARHPEKAIKNKRLVVTALAWVAVTVLIVYFGLGY